NEGVHEGRAYNSDLYITSPQTFDFDNWEFKSRDDLLKNGFSYDQGMEVIQSTSNVVLQVLPLKPILNTASPLINTYGPWIISFGTKKTLKDSRDYGLNSLKGKEPK